MKSTNIGSIWVFTELITEAIVSLAERGGSSRQALKNYIKEKYAVGENFDSQFNLAVRRGIDSEYFAQPKGPAGSIKLVKKPKAEKAEKTEKLPPAKTVKKTVKKTEDKKPVAKKAPKKKATTAATPKKAAGKITKKTAPKKSAPKKSKK